jgi:hypothetical protein
MQAKGLFSLAEITEEDAMSFFTDLSGMIALSNQYRKEVTAIFKAELFLLYLEISVENLITHHLILFHAHIFDTMFSRF